MNELSVHINIAGRAYPMEIEPEQEESVRNAGKMIQENLQVLRKNYALRDNQDALAMFSIDLATRYLRLEQEFRLRDEAYRNEIKQLQSVLGEVKL